MVSKKNEDFTKHFERRMKELRERMKKSKLHAGKRYKY
jgi:hypothetical protein